MRSSASISAARGPLQERSRKSRRSSSGSAPSSSRSLGRCAARMISNHSYAPSELTIDVPGRNPARRCAGWHPRRGTRRGTGGRARRVRPQANRPLSLTHERCPRGAATAASASPSVGFAAPSAWAAHRLRCSDSCLDELTRVVVEDDEGGGCLTARERDLPDQVSRRRRRDLCVWGRVEQGKRSGRRRDRRVSGHSDGEPSSDRDRLIRGERGWR